MDLNAYSVKLDKLFIKKLSERTVHLSNLLRIANSHYLMKKWSYLLALERFIKGLLREKLLVIVCPFNLLNLAIYSEVFVKRKPNE